MTTQEAIEYIKAHRNPDYPNGKTDWEIAMTMAINALKTFENGTETKSYSKDTISRQAAIDLVRDVCDAIMSGCESWYDPDTGDEVYKDIREVDAILKCNKEIRIALRSMPSAQLERKHGEWEEIAVIADAYDISGVKTWASKMKCDQCGFTTIAIEGHFSQYNYCPYCGADMRGEDNE